jgi:hypothetical protein
MWNISVRAICERAGNSWAGSTVSIHSVTCPPRPGRILRGLDDEATGEAGQRASPGPEDSADGRAAHGDLIPPGWFRPPECRAMLAPVDPRQGCASGRYADEVMGILAQRGTP